MGVNADIGVAQHFLHRADEHTVFVALGFAHDDDVVVNPAVDPVRFALWTLRDEAAQRRSP